MNSTCLVNQQQLSFVAASNLDRSNLSNSASLVTFNLSQSCSEPSRTVFQIACHLAACHLSCRIDDQSHSQLAVKRKDTMKRQKVVIRPEAIAATKHSLSDLVVFNSKTIRVTEFVQSYAAPQLTEQSLTTPSKTCANGSAGKRGTTLFKPLRLWHVACNRLVTCGTTDEGDFH